MNGIYNEHEEDSGNMDWIKLILNMMDGQD